jgi:hypothetical protein
MSEHTPAPLDLDAWIDGAERPEAEVTLAAKGKSLAVLNDLRDKRARDLRKRPRTPGRMTPEDESHDLDEQIAELEAEVKASERTFRVRGIDGDTHQAILNDLKGQPANLIIEAIVAAAMIEEPPVDREKVHRLRQMVGEGQFKLLSDTVQRASFEAPDLDF